MYPRILHIYGPLWVNSYGAMIALGVLVFVWLMQRDQQAQKLIHGHSILDLITVGVFAGVAGGRALFAIMNPDMFAHNWIEVLYPWVGGFSLLGTILAVVVCIPLYWRSLGIAVLPLLDRVGVYAPLLQSIARIGCFLAGCCYGAPLASSHPLSICYTHPDSLAPLHQYIHPAQLYSCFASLVIFLVMYCFVQYRVRYAGQVFCTYLFLESLARFFADFWRGERELGQNIFGIGAMGSISSYQLLALAIALGALCAFFVFGAMQKSTLIRAKN